MDENSDRARKSREIRIGARKATNNSGNSPSQIGSGRKFTPDPCQVGGSARATEKECLAPPPKPNLRYDRAGRDTSAKQEDQPWARFDTSGSSPIPRS
jgi:hypothetical protein